MLSEMKRNVLRFNGPLSRTFVNVVISVKRFNVRLNQGYSEICKTINFVEVSIID